MMLLGRLRRLNESAVVWAWVFNFLRMSSGVLLLPLLLRTLSEPDLGMYYVFLMLVSLMPILDQAFSFNIARFVGFALGGAVEIRALGVHPAPAGSEPNYQLTWNLLHATQRLYLWVAVGTTAVLGFIGWFMVAGRVDETTYPPLTWLAAGLALLAAGAEIYSVWWNAFLRGLNRVRDSVIVLSVGYGVKLALSIAFLLLGLGLAAVPVAGIAGALVQRSLSKRHCLAALPDEAGEAVRLRVGDLLTKLWPTSWRVGLQLLSGYALINGLSFLCLDHFGLETSARFGISWQVMMMVQGMAGAFTGVVWPRVAQLRARGDVVAIRRLLGPKILRQSFGYLLMAGALVILGQTGLDLLGSGKHLLPRSLLALMALNVGLEMQFSVWTTLLATENRVPSLWPTVATNAAALSGAYAAVVLCSRGVEVLVLAPLLCGGVFNYWFWPWRGARNVQTTWLRFMLFTGDCAPAGNR